MFKFLLAPLSGLFGVQTEPPKVTVFVHGTDLIPKTNIKPVEKLIRHEPGMFALKKDKLSYVYTKYLNNLCKYNPKIFPKEHAHIFCWSGTLKHQERLKAAHNLHQELNSLSLSYKQKIHLSIVTHSHGGNVALNLAQVKGKREYTINELILLAVPVQENTKNFVTDNCFKKTKIYSIYSTGDMMQVLAPQGIKCPSRRVYRKIFCNKTTKPIKKRVPLFSKRTFPHQQVRQIKVKHGKRSPCHMEFLLPPFTKNFTTLLQTASTHDFSKSVLIFKY